MIFYKKKKNVAAKQKSNSIKKTRENVNFNAKKVT